ncbi:hypothetical protein D3C86_1336410 [compost metagenome]
MQLAQVLAVEQEFLGLQIDRGDIRQVIAGRQGLVGLVGVAFATKRQVLQTGGDLSRNRTRGLAPFQRARRLAGLQVHAPLRRAGTGGVERQVVQGVAAGSQDAGGQADALRLRQDGLGRRSALAGRRAETVGDGFPAVHVQIRQAGVQAQPTFRQAGGQADAEGAASKVRRRGIGGVPFEQRIDVIAQAGSQPAPVLRAPVLGRPPLQLQQLGRLGGLADRRGHVDRQSAKHPCFAPGRRKS